MKILVYSDLQADDGRERCFGDSGKLLQLYRVEKFYKDLVDISKFTGASGVWDLGDTTDNQSNLSLPTLSCTLSGLEKLCCSFVDNGALLGYNIKLIGNHDFYLKDSSVHNGLVFSSAFPEIISTPRFIKLKDCVVIGIGYPVNYSTDTINQVEQVIHEAKKVAQRESIPLICLVHAEIIGAVMPSTTVRSGFPTSLFKEADLTLAGHIHKPQTLKGNIHYVGSPFQQDFGESGEAKRVAIVDTETATLKWAELRGFPVYKTVNYNEFKSYPDNEDRLKVVIASEAEAAQFFAHQKSSRARPDFTFLKVENKANEVEMKPLDFNLQSCMEEWVKSRPVSGVDNDVVISYGKKLLDIC